MKYFSTFSGIGGFEVGIGDKGECVGFSEINKPAIAVYKYHFPKHENFSDITKIVTADLPDFDLFVGGFPCQSFSIAGKRGGFQDTRGTLFFEIARIAKVKRPAYLLLENVKGLLNHDKGNTFATIISTLDELGYDCEWHVNNSKNFGVPQNRERVFIIGYLRGQPRPKVFPIGRKTKSIARCINRKQIKILGLYCDENRIYDINNIFPTCSVTTCGLVKIQQRDGRVRRLMPIETERLQAFPDSWTKFGINEKGEKVEIFDSQRYKMCGNAVTTNVVRHIINQMFP